MRSGLRKALLADTVSSISEGNAIVKVDLPEAVVSIDEDRWGCGQNQVTWWWLATRPNVNNAVS